MTDLAEHYEEHIRRLTAERDRLRAAIAWALGEKPDKDGGWFGEDVRRPGPYWWRTHLRALAEGTKE
jgi:hypothetical protein